MLQYTPERPEDMEEQKIPLRLLLGMPPNIPSLDYYDFSSDAEDHIYETIDDSSLENEVELLSESSDNEYYATVHIDSSDSENMPSEHEHHDNKLLANSNANFHEQRNCASDNFVSEGSSSSNKRPNDAKEKCEAIYDSDGSSRFSSLSLDVAFSDSSTETPIRPDLFEDISPSKNDNVLICMYNNDKPLDVSNENLHEQCNCGPKYLVSKDPSSSNNKPNDIKEISNQTYDSDTSSSFSSVSLDVTFSDSSSGTPIRPDLFEDISPSNNDSTSMMCMLNQSDSSLGYCNYAFDTSSTSSDSVSIRRSNQGEFSVGYHNHGFDCIIEFSNRNDNIPLGHQIPRIVLSSAESTAIAPTKETKVNIHRQFCGEKCPPCKTFFRWCIAYATVLCVLILLIWQKMQLSA